MYGTDAWKIWNIPTIQPPFIDARIITASAESYQSGFNPEIENPRDPYGRLFNLPSVWKILFLTGINQSHTNILAGILISFFCFGLISFAGRLNHPSALIFVLCAFTPPILLAFERGNVDLLIFLVCALALIWLNKSPLISVIFLGLAGILKIFPVFGLVALLHLDRRQFTRYSAWLAMVFGSYCLLTFENFRRVFANTEVGSELSYGLGVLPFYIEKTSGSYEYAIIANLLSVFLAMLIVLLSLYWVARPDYKLGQDLFHHLPAFRLGAGIYLGTFLLGNNWDYRLMFLLFTIPQLVDWITQSRVAKPTLLAIIFSFSYLWVYKVLPFAYFIDELANWVVFAGLFYLLTASFPDWLMQDLQNVFGRNKVNNV